MRNLLEALGRQARWALPIGVFVGILVPPLASLARPLLTAAVIGTLTVTLMRLDWRRLADALARPGRALGLTCWQLVASPLLLWLACLPFDPPPGLSVALLLQAAAPPIGSAAAFALFLGIDGALALVATVASTLLLPVTLTAVVALVLAAHGIQVDLLAFFMRVLLLVAAPFVIALAARRLLGLARLERAAGVLAGANVLLLVVFAIAVMDGVTATLLADPATVLGLLGMAVLMAAIWHLAGWLLFLPGGPNAALSAALASGNRNMGLMLAITAGTAGPLFSLYVGVAQIPMYFAPLLLAPLARTAIAEAGTIARRGS